MEDILFQLSVTYTSVGGRLYKGAGVVIPQKKATLTPPTPLLTIKSLTELWGLVSASSFHDEIITINFLLLLLLQILN